MYTDVCEILPVSRNATYGDEVLGTAFETKCREENNDTLKKGQSGSGIGAKRLYVLPPGIEVSIGDRVKTIKRRGVVVVDQYASIDEVFPIGRFKPHHIEVVIYNV